MFPELMITCFQFLSLCLVVMLDSQKTSEIPLDLTNNNIDMNVFFHLTFGKIRLKTKCLQYSKIYLPMFYLKYLKNM